MYNKRQFTKARDKKVLHKIGKQWQVISLSLLMAIGGLSIAGHSIKAYADNNSNNTNTRKVILNASAQSLKLKSKYNKFTRPSLSNDTSNNHNNGTRMVNNPSVPISQSNNQSKNQEMTPSVSDIVTAINNNNWNQRYGSMYSDLLSKLNYNDIHVLDNPTAYNNYVNGTGGVKSTNTYENNLSGIQRDLDAFSGYSKVRALRNLMDLPIASPSLYNPVFSNPLFNGFENSFNNNDINYYNNLLNNFSSLKADRQNKNNQTADLQKALNNLNHLSNDAKNAITKFYGISVSDVQNEISSLKSGTIPQGMVYQPIKLVFYDIANRRDPNSNNEIYAKSNTPVGSNIIHESDFGSASPNTMVKNPKYPEYSINGYYFINKETGQKDELVPQLIANKKLNVPNGYTWNGLENPGANGSNYETSDSGRREYYYVVPQQQLHFHLVPTSEANNPETVVAYVRKSINLIPENNNSGNDSYYDTNKIKQLGGTLIYNGPKNNQLDGVYGYLHNRTLFLGGNFSQYCKDNTDSFKTNGGYQELLPENVSPSSIKKIVLEDSKGLSGNCSYMLANLPNLQYVVRVGDFSDNVHNDGGPSNISHIFANDKNLLRITDKSNSSWSFDDNDRGGAGLSNNADYAFYNDHSLFDITGLEKWDMTGFTTMNHMFDGDCNLTNLSPISNWDVGGVKNMDYAFANSASADSKGFNEESLNDLAPWNLRQIDSAQGLFYGDHWINSIPKSWMRKPIGTGSPYPNLVDAFKNTQLKFNPHSVNDDNPEWIPLNNENPTSGSWLPKMYRTEEGHYSFTPVSDAVYFGNPLNNFNGIFYKNDGYLILSSNNFINTKDQLITLPPKAKLTKELYENGINPQNIRNINITGNLNIPSPNDGSLHYYFANLPNLRSIQGGESLYNGWSSHSKITTTSPVDIKGLFYNDPKLNSVIGFFGNEQAVKDNPATGRQSSGLIHKTDADNNKISNLISNSTSTAHMFDGDHNLFNDSNAQANVDAISSIPMNSIKDASYMFNNTGLNDSNIVTNWNLSNLQNADHMFNGCNLSNLNGFNRLGDWNAISKLKPYKGHWDYNGYDYYYPSGKKEVVDNSFKKIVPTHLQNASYMFANNPHLIDISGISGNNININSITNVSDMFSDDTDLKDVSPIENGNNKWDFDQRPIATDIFNKTGIKYNTPEIIQRHNDKYILSPVPNTDINIDIIHFNNDLNNNTNNIAKQGTNGTHGFVVAPDGYHFKDKKNNESFIFNGKKHTFNVIPNQYIDTINYVVQNNSNYVKHNQTLGHFNKQLDDSRTDDSNVKFTVNSNNDINIPSGYHLVNNATVVGNHQNNSTDTVLIAPNSARFTVNFMHNNNKIGSKTYNGVVDNRITINSKTVGSNGDIPYNYAISNGQPTTFTYSVESSKNIANIQVSPQTTSETINYIYNNGKKILNEGSKISSGTYGTQGTVSAPSGYHFSDNKNRESFIYNGNTYVFNVTKNTNEVVPSVTPNKPVQPNRPTAPNKPGNNNGNGNKKMPNKSIQPNKPITPNKPSNNNDNGDSVIPNIPFTPFNPVNSITSTAPSSASSLASSSVAPSSVAPSSTSSASSSFINSKTQMTNKNYPIQYNYHKSNNDVVTYHGRKYNVHYHNNGKNTIRVRERVTEHGHRTYRYRNVVVNRSLPTPYVDAKTTQLVDRINFHQRGKRIFTNYGLIKAINKAKPGIVFNHRGQKFAVIEVPDHFRYFMVRKNSKVVAFGKHHSRLVLKPNHLLTIHIRRIFVVHTRHANYVRYEIQLHHHNYWVAGRDDFVPNSYLQKSNLKARHSHRIQVIRHCGLYTSHIYNSHTHIKSLKRGTILHVKKVINLGRKSNYQTRFILTNGDFVTSNKNFVRIYK